jgi:hypothetical protein
MLLTSNSPHRHRGSLLGWAAALIAVSAALLVPWMAHLAATLPGTVSARHWPMAWAGLDGAEAVVLGTTAWLAIRRDRRLPSVAAAAATLLLADAWFDVTTAPPGGSTAFALLDMVIEIGVAATCLLLARLARRDPRFCGPDAAPARAGATAASGRGRAEAAVRDVGRAAPGSGQRVSASGPVRHRDLRLPRSDWMLRVARGSAGRPALEVHDTRGITDVSVAVPAAISVLRGACRSARSAPLPWSVAWGQLPQGADGVEVVFRSGKLVERARAVSIAGQFWVAEVPGRYRAVTVSAGPKRATARVLTRADGKRDPVPRVPRSRGQRRQFNLLPHIFRFAAAADTGLPVSTPA